MKVLFGTKETAQKMAELFEGESDNLNCVDFQEASIKDLSEFIAQSGIEAYPQGFYCLRLEFAEAIVTIPISSAEAFRFITKSWLTDFDWLRDSLEQESWALLINQLATSFNSQVSPTFFSDDVAKIAEDLNQISQKIENL